MLKILTLSGPTASGKTAVASEISKRLPVEIISFDSMQVYRGMSVTTQAPSRQAALKSKTHLVSFLRPTEEYNAALFRKNALALIPKILKKKKIPFLVGGTGLYLRALLDGLFESGGNAAPGDEKLRHKLVKEHELHGAPYLHDQLKAVDEILAKKIHPNDARRIIRALEVYALTGRPMSGQMSNRKGISGQYDCRVFFLNRDRADLYARVNRRVDKMFRAGLVAEVKKLIRRKLSKTAGMALGVRETAAYLQGELTLREAKELLKKNTRNYAKRQISWFRHERDVQNIAVAAGDTAEDIAKKILSRW
ncbi:MAG: tRNA (adenosine(37)-N6)-dimethylallyltransferase MiaA [Omnitrophica bacterium RIFCSPHIGHO2_02_FULL_51_18]|nr:MAG: tRNA (adenosine(37)-N6)-dimethylallyltransferase MiaA [Omnitrophica bacterium RIFCSPHIGHO2_02_FULL_51_18]